MSPDMFTNRHKYFRWTPRTTWITFAYVVVVPSIFGYMGYVTDVSSSYLVQTNAKADEMTQGKWDMRGKRRGDTMAEF